MKNLTEEQKTALVDEVLNNFDFQKVLKCMRVTKWKWREKEPSLMDLIRQSEKLLFKVLNDDKISSCGTGGFHASLDAECLTLTFRLEETVTYINDGEA